MHFDWKRYPRPNSDILPHLLHEHQVGFINRVVLASYRTRALMDADKGKLSGKSLEMLDEYALDLTRYILFADEVPLPKGGIPGTQEYIRDFQRNRLPSSKGFALKDLDLQTRLLKHRCSYMVHSLAFKGMPDPLKERVLRRIGKALHTTRPDPAFAYMPPEEKDTIRRILWDTLPEVRKL